MFNNGLVEYKESDSSYEFINYDYSQQIVKF